MIMQIFKKTGRMDTKFMRDRQDIIARPGIRLCGIASMLAVLPAPLSAEVGPRDNIVIALSNRIVASTVATGDKARAVPGAIVDFFVTVTGPTENGSPATSFAVTDMVPAHLSLFVGDLGQVGTGPAAFVDNDSGLDFRFDGLSSSTDSIEFSDDGGKTFEYVPVADGDGFDPHVTHVKFRPRGSLMPVSGKYDRFSLRYRMKVK
jgi:hypothetical protein|tara:strand:+ start:25708 stop:26322 length:615 start_codon:yes stop_codon:yes gene_type:complete